MASKKTSFKQAAFEILSAEQEPLSPREITALAFQRGLLSTEGVTPEATMGAQLYVDIKENKSSKFKKAGKGRFTLKEQTESSESPVFLIEKHNAFVEKALMQKLYNMDPFQFEYLLADLLQKIGYENAVVTKRSGDKGIDITADLTMDGITNVKTVVQAKRYKKGNTIQSKVIRELRGSAEVDQRGLVITTSDFSTGAVKESKAANKMPVSLINGSKLLALLVKHNVGVKNESVTLYSLDNEYFDNEDGENSQQLDTGKHRSIWPLPGGTGSYVSTLFQFMERIDAGEHNKRKLAKWYMRTFDNVNSEKVALGYVRVAFKMGLTQLQNDKIVFTSAGKEVLETRDIDLLYNTISKNILAFDDIVEFLKTAKEAQNEQRLLEYLKDAFNIDWSTYTQLNFRLMWLLNLDKIKKVEGGYLINSD